MKLSNVIEFASKLNESYSSVEFFAPNFTAVLNCTTISVPRNEIKSIKSYFCEAPLHCKVVDVLLDDSDKIIQNVMCINVDCMNHESLSVNDHYKMKCEFCYDGSVICHGFKKI